LKLPAHVLFRKELSLMGWKPHGTPDQALVNEIVAFVEKVGKESSLSSRNRLPIRHENDSTGLER